MKSDCGIGKKGRGRRRNTAYAVKKRLLGEWYYFSKAAYLHIATKR